MSWIKTAPPFGDTPPHTPFHAPLRGTEPGHAGEITVASDIGRAEVPGIILVLRVALGPSLRNLPSPSH